MKTTVADRFVLLDHMFYLYIFLFFSLTSESNLYGLKYLYQKSQFFFSN